jgi:hypothetical protein
VQRSNYGFPPNRATVGERERVAKKKADVAEHPEVFGRDGLLVNEPPGSAGLPFV